MILIQVERRVLNSLPAAPLCPAEAHNPPVLFRVEAAPIPTFWPDKITPSIP